MVIIVMSVSSQHVFICPDVQVEGAEKSVVDEDVDG